MVRRLQPPRSRLWAARTLRRLVAAAPAGELVRLAGVAVAIAAGVVLAVEAYPLAAPWLHGAVGWGD
jgi:hypothetical protein